MVFTTGLTEIDDIVAKMKQELDDEFPPTVFTLGFGADHDVNFMKVRCFIGMDRSECICQYRQHENGTFGIALASTELS